MKRFVVALTTLASMLAFLPEAPADPGCWPSCPGLLLSAQANQLDVYDLSSPVPGTTRTTAIPAHSHDPDAEPGTDPVGHGNDVNGQVCRIEQGDGRVRYLMGEDSDQDLVPNGFGQGWGFFAPTGGVTGPWTLEDKIVAPYRVHDNDHQPENTGCAVSPDASRLFLVDIGAQAFDVPGVGSVFMYTRDEQGDFSSDSPGCVLADDMTTAGYIAFHPDGSLLVPESGRFSGGAVSRFVPPFPDPSDCAAYKAAHTVTGRDNFLQSQPDLLSYVPISIVRRGDRWLVGNVVPGQVNEYDMDGAFVRPVALGQGPGVAGLAVDAVGNLYIANLGLVPCATILCPADGAGSLWKVSFDPVTDTPLPAVPVNVALTYPEGLGTVVSL